MATTTTTLTRDGMEMTVFVWRSLWSRSLSLVLCYDSHTRARTYSSYSFSVDTSITERNFNCQS